MTATKVTYNNIFTQVWQNVYDLINNRINVADPISLSSSSSYRKFVYTREPDIKSLDFSEYPFIIISPASTETSGNQTLDSKKGALNSTIRIEVITCDRGFGNRDGRGSIDNDSISNDIAETLNNATNRTTLRNNGLPFLRVVASGAVPEESHNTLIYRRTIVVNLSNKMFKVSA